MAKKARLGLLACLGVVALAVAGPALAGTSSKLGVSQTPSSGVVIHYTQSPSDAAIAKITIYSDPLFLAPGHSVNLSQAPGTTIGTVSAKATASSLGGATLPLTGTIVVKAATDTYSSNGTPVPFANAAVACTGTASHTTYWDLMLTAAGQTLEVPVFVDLVPTTLNGAANPETTATTGWGSTEIKVCLPSPDVPAPQGAAFGAKPFDVTMAIKGVYFGSSSEYRWRAVVVPYTPGTATVNPTGAVEIQGLMRRYGFVAAFVHYNGRSHTATVRGTVTEAGAAVVGAPVVITGGTKKATAKTNDTGDFKVTIKIGKGTPAIHVTANVPQRDLGASACSATPAFGGIPCADTSVGGWTMTVKARRVAR